ncbi:unnamed protein product [Musa acuminata subsp. malaccensis]|uniref:(wild Malaysian banana) hypothetical protein n=1 Tax=Musa acuminata subsp. malaccensis TaxID=214687 RepID=A0A804L4D4_MUSAM|nr:PREDICTED: uncharacterized protein LOC103970456 [Musa acuminata subsp. malaccensis]CAG1863594.1 unnamed protein product [Musa acuminata subsp. malaccensis]
MDDFERRNRDEHRYSAADHDRGHPPYDGGYRNEFRAYGAGAGDRRLEIVKGNVFSANQTSYYAADRDRHPSPPPRRRSRDPPFPPPQRSGLSSAGSSAWCFTDPEAKRRRRVASYKAYAVEGKVKASFRKGFRWIKVKCSELVHGW